MDCIILAAGRGARLGSLTEATPKALLLWKHVPLIEHQLRSLDPLRVSRCIIVVGYLAEKVVHHVSALGPQLVPITFVHQDRIGLSELAIHQAIESCRSKVVLVRCVDDLLSRLETDWLSESEPDVIRAICRYVESTPLPVFVDMGLKTVAPPGSLCGGYVITYNLAAPIEILQQWRSSGPRPLADLMIENSKWMQMLALRPTSSFEVNTMEDFERQRSDPA